MPARTCLSSTFAAECRNPRTSFLAPQASRRKTSPPAAMRFHEIETSFFFAVDQTKPLAPCGAAPEGAGDHSCAPPPGRCGSVGETRRRTRELTPRSFRQTDAGSPTHPTKREDLKFTCDRSQNTEASGRFRPGE